MKDEKTIINPTIIEMLRESNHIEQEYSEEALEDAIEAWKYARENDDNISFEWLIEIHRILLRRLDPEIAGKLRDYDVWVGGRHCRFISHGLLKEEVNECLEAIKNAEPLLDGSEEMREEFSKEEHVRFEKIHPFGDGNGRTGRILYNIHRLKLGLPIHVIREDEKHEYYKWFQ